MHHFNCWRSVPLPCGQYMAIFIDIVMAKLFCFVFDKGYLLPIKRIRLPYLTEDIMKLLLGLIEHNKNRCFSKNIFVAIFCRMNSPLFSSWSSQICRKSWLEMKWVTLWIFRFFDIFFYRRNDARARGKWDLTIIWFIGIFEHLEMFHELLEVGGEMFQQQPMVVLLFHQTNLTFKIKTVEKYQQLAKKNSRWSIYLNSNNWTTILIIL